MIGKGQNYALVIDIQSLIVLFVRDFASPPPKAKLLMQSLIMTACGCRRRDGAVSVLSATAQARRTRRERALSDH